MKYINENRIQNMPLENSFIQQKLTEKFGEELTDWEQQYGLLTFTAPKDMNLKVLQYLWDDEELNFRFLTDICAVHYPEKKEEELAVIYHLHNLQQATRLRMKVFTAVAKPDVFTATKLYESANWMERETYDFYGINFLGHPNLIRILNVNEMDYFPMRKEFPLEDQTRVDKDDEMFGRGGSYN